VFCEKRLQAIENKGSELQKERQESSRARNSMKKRDLHCAAGRKHSNVAKTHRVAEERKDETGTRQQNLGLEITASVTICQVRNKDCGLNGLRASLRSGSTRDAEENAPPFHKRQPCLPLTPVFEVSSKPGPLQIKGSGTRQDA
jgi:hypothetical protein